MLTHELAHLSRQMPHVEKYRLDLQHLAAQWQLLGILGQMSGTGTEMEKTRGEFDGLTETLLEQLAAETLNKVVQNLSSKAQVAVDILIRNLFERTADIGFLATDADVRGFIAGGAGARGKTGLQARFREYVAKYSVYYNIVLLDTEGRVLVQMDEGSGVAQTEDAIVRAALSTTAEYVEAFRVTDLVPGGVPALLYGYRVTSEGGTGKPLGVLCLCFRFEDELEGIFGNLVGGEDWTVLSILDAEGAVIASSDPYQVPVGAKLQRVLEQDYKIVRFAGREYIAKTCATKGYQGFMGLGWQGHAMIPVDKAFQTRGSNSLLKRVEPKILDAVMRDPRLFSEALRAIPLKAEEIQEELDLTVWNGNVRQTTREAKVLLWNISTAGGRTKEIFEASIGNLHETVISAILEDVEFQAALAVDIMDRNLYERANDCRWWALTSDFRQLLAAGEFDGAAAERIGGILQYINGLYTVYTNLFVYDLEGRIVAVSNPEEADWVGRQLNAPWVRATLELTGSQAYSVSEFEETALYGGRPTYIYGARITDLEGSAACGGIGIVFDSAPQFQAMLRDCLPQDEHGEPLAGYLGFFIDRGGRVLAASDADWPRGVPLRLPEAFLTADNGHGHAGIWALNGQYYAVGARVSSGYREYKRVDGYRNDVIAVILAPLAEVGQVTAKAAVSQGFTYRGDEGARGEDSVEIATFRVGERTFGVQTQHICGAVTASGLTRIPGSHPLLAGKIAYDGKAVPVIAAATLIGETENAHTQSGKIIVLRSGKGRLGIRVDALGEIPTLPRKLVDFNATLLDESDKYTEGVILPENSRDYHEMVVLIDPSRLSLYLASEAVFA